MSDINQVQDEIIDEFTILEGDRESTIFYIMELGNQLSEFPEEAHLDENLIKGCQSKVWLTTEDKDQKVVFKADSNTDITKGLISLLIPWALQSLAREATNATLLDDAHDKVARGVITASDVLRVVGPRQLD